MAPKPKAQDKKADGAQIGIRIDGKTLARLEALRTRPDLPGVTLSFADVARATITAGLDVLEKKRNK